MFKLLICDDEQPIRSGLAKIIDWRKLGFELCGEAEDGNEALKKILKLKPDLVMLDIRMPGLSGVEVLKETYKKNLSAEKRPHFLILSGFSEFEYAQQAMNYGATGYFVKPVDEDLLEEKVREIAARLNKARDDLENINIPHKFSQMFLHGSVEKSFGENADTQSDYQVAIISAFYSGIEIKKIEAKAKNIFDADKTFLIKQENQIVVVFKDCSELFVKYMLERLASFMGEGTNIVAGPRGKGLAAALDSFLAAQKCLPRLFYEAGKKFILASGEENAADEKYGSAETRAEVKPLKDEIPQILFCIETYDRKNVAEIFLRYEENRKSATPPPYAPENVRAELIAFVIELQNALHQKYPEREFPKESAFDLVPKIMGERRFVGAFAIVRKFTFDFLELFNTNTNTSMITKMIQYIKANYADDLKLKSLGQQFFCNSAYLGKKFKEMTGESFNVFLDKVRIDEAKRMLSETELKVYQISKLVGYCNTDYFFIKFKKYTGMTPKDYQKKIK